MLSFVRSDARRQLRQTSEPGVSAGVRDNRVNPVFNGCLCVRIPLVHLAYPFVLSPLGVCSLANPRETLQKTYHAARLFRLILPSPKSEPKSSARILHEYP